MKTIMMTNDDDDYDDNIHALMGHFYFCDPEILKNNEASVFNPLKISFRFIN
jgi:hypothetical protein